MKVIITGTTGMVGKAVLMECIDNSIIKEILIINRNSLDVSNSKVKEVIHKDFRDFSTIKDKLEGYDACFHCMGVSSTGMNEEKFHEITYNMTKALVDTLYETNSEIIFNYVSGAGTDSSEKSNTMWARVKGKTENMILNKGFKDAYMFRPGVILPEKGIKSRTKLYNVSYIVLKPFFPLLRKMKSVTTTTKIGKAMINSLLKPQTLKHLEGSDINKLATIILKK